MLLDFLKIKKLFTHNAAQKILAFSLAFFIWLLASAPQKQEQSVIRFFIPVTYQNLPKDLEIVSKEIQSINIAVEVKRANQGEVHPSNFQALLDLSRVMEGDNTIYISEKNIKSTVDNINVISVSPSEVELKFEKVIEKRLPIRPVIVGGLAKGFVINDIHMEPKFANLRGPTSILEKMDQVETSPVNVNELDSDIDIAVNLNLPKRVRFLDKVEFLAARIKVGSEPMNLRIDQVPIGLVNQVYVTRINPKEFNVLLRGPKSILEKFSRDDIRAVIDLQHYKPGTYKIKEPKLYHPPSIQVQKVWPPIDIWVLKQKIYE